MFSLVLLLAAVGLTQSRPAALTPELVLSAPYIFRGTVVRKGSPMPLPPATAATATVRVDEIFRGAALIGDFTGREIVVERTAASSSGDTGTSSGGAGLLFFTRPIHYGRTLAVAEIAELPAGNSRQVRNRIAAIERDEADRLLAGRLSNAETVIVGRVIGVSSLQKRERRPTEHDPEWMLARVRVVRRLAGQPRLKDCGDAGACVEVVFAGSKDIVWFRAPKLAPGAEVLLLLRHEPKSPVRVGDRPDSDAYLLIDPADARPVSEQRRIRGLLARKP